MHFLRESDVAKLEIVSSVTLNFPLGLSPSLVAAALNFTRTSI